MMSSLLLLSSSSQALPLANSNNSAFYYQIGGARSISLAPNINVMTQTLGGSYEFGLGYSCGNFDPTLGVSNILNDLQNLGNNLINGAVGAVSAAIGGLPALILQRIDPGLYDLFQNAVIRAEAIISLANKTCEDYERQIRLGENPYGGWADLSKMIDWKVQMGANGFGNANVDVNQAKQQVQTDNGDNGLPWISGNRAGGVNQPAIKTTTDSIIAGYNLTLNRNANDVTAPNVPPNAIKPRLVELFPNPNSAASWAVDVIGDVLIKTHDNHIPQTTPGHGLLPKIDHTMASLQSDLQDLVNGNQAVTLDHLQQVSSDSVLINWDVITSIQNLEASEQALSISKLASEVSMTQTLEKAMTIRRLLLTASREPNINGNGSKALLAIQESIARLDRDIESVMFERRIYNDLASRTSGLVLQLQNQHENRAGSTQQDSGRDDKIIETGAVKP